MKSIHTLVLIVFGLFCSPAFAQQNQCKGLPTYITTELSDANCECGKRLSNLRVTPPAGTTLVAACSLRWELGNSREYIDLSKSVVSLDDLSKSVVSLDEYTNGDFPDGTIDGTIFLAGELVITGSVRVEPGPAGDIWFTPQWGFSNTKSAFSSQMAKFKFIQESDYEAFRANERIRITGGDRGNETSGCSVAQAKIRVKGFRVVIEEGAYPLVTQVLYISPYEDCSVR